VVPIWHIIDTNTIKGSWRTLKWWYILMYLHALQGFIISVTNQRSDSKAHSVLFTNEFLEAWYQVCASERDNFHHTHSNHAKFLENTTLYICVWCTMDHALWYICVIRTNKMHFFLLIYFNNHPLHVSNRLTIHHQEVFYCICSIWHLIN